MKKDTKSVKTSPASLSLLNSQCAGIDVGASELFVCIAKNSSEQEVRSFPTFTADLQQMIHWLKNNGVKSVAMESTGVYSRKLFVKPLFPHVTAPFLKNRADRMLNF